MRRADHSEAVGDAAAEHRADDTAGEQATERHAGQSVLLAEDNVINRLVARELLTNTGLVVEQAENGAIALELALVFPAVIFELNRSERNE